MTKNELGNYVLSSDQMGHEIRKAVALDDKYVLLLFNTGEWRVLNARSFAEHASALEELRKPDVFATAHAVDGVVEWDTGAALDPDVCYWESIPAADHFCSERAAARK